MVWTARAIVAASSLLSGLLHYDIWANHGYRGAPVREMFVFHAVAASAAAALALVPRRWAPAPAVALAAASLVAFALSRTSGVPTLHGTFSEAGLQPSSATLLGVSAALVILVTEAVVVIGGSLLIARPRLDIA